MKRILLAATALTMFAGAAVAADMPARTNYTKAPIMVPAYNWSGLYVGLNAGYGWTNGGAGALGDTDGFVGGGQIGYNWQFNQIVLGIEADIQGADLSNGPVAGVSTDIDYIGTVRGRIGYAWDRWMVYATGGYAYGRSSVTTGAGSANNDFDGGVYGAGLEWAFAPSWSAKLEYLHFDINSDTFGVGPVAFTTGDRDLDLVRVGVNYKFGWGGFWR